MRYTAPTTGGAILVLMVASLVSGERGWLIAAAILFSLFALGCVFAFGRAPRRLKPILLGIAVSTAFLGALIADTPGGGAPYQGRLRAEWMLLGWLAGFLVTLRGQRPRRVASRSRETTENR